MSRLARTTLIWLIALALPVQGFAAAAMISCGPMHGGMAAAVPESHAGHEASEHAHHHGDGISAAQDPAEPQSDFAKFIELKCSACASCCTAPAAPSPVMPFSGLVPAHAVAIPFFGSSESTTVPDRLERPPRTFLA
jgi:hypothetical protein